MAENQFAAPGRPLPDPQAVHTRALAGMSGDSKQIQGGVDTPAGKGILQHLQEAAFGLMRPQDATEDQLKATQDLSALAARVSELPVSEDERNAIVQRLSDCIRPAVKLLDGNQEAALRWMNTPIAVLDGEVPLELALGSDDGAYEVEQLIGRIQYGVFA